METFNSDDPCANNARNIGIVAGTVLGAIAGHQVDKNAGKFVGAGVGALVGGLIGADIDRKKCELSRIAKKHALDMTFTDIQFDGAKGGKEEKLGFSVSIKDQESGGHFLSGSDQLAPKAQAYFNEIATEYSFARQNAKLPSNASAEAHQAVEQLRDKRLLIIGHTDDTGSSRLNADLSERRAKAVARLFRDAGIADVQIYFQGAGETLPIADNRSDDGRARNRRVEIVDLSSEATFKNYLATRKARVDYYRVGSPAMAAAASAAEQQGGAGKKDRKARKAAPVAKAVPAQPPAAKPTPAGATAASVTAPGATATAASPVPATASAAPARGGAAAGNRKASPATSVETTAPAYDFGGTPVGKQAAGPIDIGRLVAERSGFHVISPAQADDAPLLRSCSDDRPRIANGVKSLRDGREISTAEYLPNLFDTSWADVVNGHLVALSHVAVLRDGGSPARSPELRLYKNYRQRASTGAKADFLATPEVNTYQGEKGLLYRVFVKNGPVRCMDIVIPNASQVATGSRLYYGAPGQAYMTGFNPRIAK